ncbi:ATP-binding protein [Streptomyces sp. NPDC093594]|uniref:ATP-binding protein n=1 Tax=Streptomyces sp. NPDC093594 TaxID=3155305 RepID=UPI00344F8F3B
MEFCASLVDDPMAVRTARRFTINAMRKIGAAAADDQAGHEAAVLVASELVTNACAHTAGVVNLRLSWDGSALTIEVDDKDGSACPPAIVLLAESGERGATGLCLVDRLSELWGTSSHHSGKTVFARVRLATDAALFGAAV